MKKKHIIIISICSGFVAVLLIFLICFYSIPRITYGYDKTTDTYYVDTVYGDAKTYTIKDEIHSKPVTKIKSRAFMKKKNLTTIYMKENIKEIERLAFLDCEKLTTIDLSSVEIIGRNAFENCRSLSEVHLTLYDILGGTFMGCTQLKNIVLDNTKTIGSFAFGNTCIVTITIPQTCSDVGEDAFYGCEHLSKIVVLSNKLKNNSYLNSLSCVEFRLN